MQRYAIVGTGHRAGMYVDALLGAHLADGEIVAWVEPNPVRARVYEAQVAETIGGVRPICAPDELERALAEQRVDRVIVASVDCTHGDLVARALRAGVDVIVEKPIAAHPEQARLVVDAVRETGRDLCLTFNYRYAPRNCALREVIGSGEIGRVTSVHFDWALDTMHGADYFRRWHRAKVNNGGLLVHKSSHHFDLVNWWLGDVPERVFASGGLRFYGDQAGHSKNYVPSLTETRLNERGIDPWYLDLTLDPVLNRLYGAPAQAADGYIRNQSVFDSGITTEDTLSLLVEYRSGVALTYSLVAYAPWEGYRVTVNGTEGRAELEVVERSAVDFDESGHAELDASWKTMTDQDPVRPISERLVVQRHWERARVHPIAAMIGDHGGSDELLLTEVFHPTGKPDPLGRAATLVDGLRASGVGYAGNRSLATGIPVRLNELGLGIQV